jgi:flagellin
LRINSNSMAINAYRNLSTTNMSLGKSLEKLSSGFRINRAADDAAGLVISQNLRAQTSGLRQATRNAQDGISVVQTAEGALNEVHTMLNRMRDLSVQAANSGANDLSARTAAQSEINALTSEIDRISESTAFGGTKLLDGSYGLQATATTGQTPVAQLAGETIAVTVGGTATTGAAVLAAGTAADVGAAIAAAVNTVSGTTGVSATADATTGVLTYTNTTDADVSVVVDAAQATQDDTTAALAATGDQKQFQIGANATDILNVSIASIDATTLAVAALDVTTDAGAAAAITAFDAAIASVSTQRGTLGAVQNRFESMINNLQVTTENLVASESRIRDTDMASEMTNFTKSQILSQAGTAMLAQANQVPQGVLSLLR